MLLAVRQFAAYTYYKYGSVFLADSVLALLRREVGVHLQQVFAMNEVYLFGKEGLDVLVCLANQILRAANGGIDALHNRLEECHVALLAGDNGFPVPLVNVQ